MRSSSISKMLERSDVGTSSGEPEREVSEKRVPKDEPDPMLLGTPDDTEPVDFLLSLDEVELRDEHDPLRGPNVLKVQSLDEGMSDQMLDVVGERSIRE